jgi:hypothetical protein
VIVKLLIRFREKPVWLHLFRARARAKTSSPSTAVVFPARKSA